MEAKRQDFTNSIGLLILRLGIGGFMATHGWGKLEMLINGDAFADPIGLGSGLSLFLTVCAEFIAALLVVIGLGTRVAAALPVFAMFVAAVVFTGAGKFSVDGLIWPKWRERRARKRAATK
jgi:putative oxidoreductase